MAEKEEKSKKLPNKIIVFFVALIVVLIIVAAGSIFLYIKAQQKIAQLSTTNGQKQIAQQEVNSLLSKVEKHMMLPTNETPTVATITDVNSLKKSQPFFDGAENGDQVLVYVGAKKAIIYSPARDIIVNVGFVAVDNNGNTQASNPAQSQIKVELRNGTTTSGLAQKISESLKGSNYIVQKMTDAKNKDYTQTQVIDTGKSQNKTAIQALAQDLKTQVSTTIPDGEETSTADVLIILGNDQISQ